MCLNNDYKNKYNPYTTISLFGWLAGSWLDRGLLLLAGLM